MTTAKSKSPDKRTKAQLLEEMEKMQVLLDEAKVKADADKTAKDTQDTVATKEYDYEEEDEYVAIRPDKYIRVISLCPHILNLSTSKNRNNSKPFRFTHMGQEKRIMYQDLVGIMETNPSFVESGFLYIMNKNVVRRHGLDDAYAEILTKKEIFEVMTGDVDSALGIFNSANERQQENIAEMLETALVNDENVDMNLIYRVTQITGIDIAGRAENTKNYNDIDKDK